jgi:hypothetical protein
MKNLNWFFASLVVLTSSSFGQAQSADTAALRTNSHIISFIVELQERTILDAAEIMPAEKFSFAPTTGAFKGVRAFGEQLRHIAADNFMLGASILGEKPPVDVGTGESGDESLHTKPEIIAYLKQSFAYMRRPAAAIDDANATIPTPGISPWPAGTATRLGIAVEDCVHTFDHYGQLVDYLRMNNIIPPGSK